MKVEEEKNGESALITKVSWHRLMHLTWPPALP